MSSKRATVGLEVIIWNFITYSGVDFKEQKKSWAFLMVVLKFILDIMEKFQEI